MILKYLNETFGEENVPYILGFAALGVTLATIYFFNATSSEKVKEEKENESNFEFDFELPEWLFPGVYYAAGVVVLLSIIYLLLPSSDAGLLPTPAAPVKDGGEEEISMDSLKELGLAFVVPQEKEKNLSKPDVHRALNSRNTANSSCVTTAKEALEKYATGVSRTIGENFQHLVTAYQKLDTGNLLGRVNACREKQDQLNAELARAADEARYRPSAGLKVAHKIVEKLATQHPELELDALLEIGGGRIRTHLREVRFMLEFEKYYGTHGKPVNKNGITSSDQTKIDAAIKSAKKFLQEIAALMSQLVHAKAAPGSHQLPFDAGNYADQVTEVVNNLKDEALQDLSDVEQNPRGLIVNPAENSGYQQESNQKTFNDTHSEIVAIMKEALAVKALLEQQSPKAQQKEKAKADKEAQEAEAKPEDNKGWFAKIRNFNFNPFKSRALAMELGFDTHEHNYDPQARKEFEKLLNTKDKPVDASQHSAAKKKLNSEFKGLTKTLQDLLRKMLAAAEILRNGNLEEKRARQVAAKQVSGIANLQQKVTRYLNDLRKKFKKPDCVAHIRQELNNILEPYKLPIASPSNKQVAYLDQIEELLGQQVFTKGKARLSTLKAAIESTAGEAKFKQILEAAKGIGEAGVFEFSFTDSKALDLPEVQSKLESGFTSATADADDVFKSDASESESQHESQLKKARKKKEAPRAEAEAMVHRFKELEQHLSAMNHRITTADQELMLRKAVQGALATSYEELNYFIRALHQKAEEVGDLRQVIKINALLTYANPEVQNAAKTVAEKIKEQGGKEETVQTYMELTNFLIAWQNTLRVLSSPQYTPESNVAKTDAIANSHHCVEKARQYLLDYGIALKKPPEQRIKDLEYCIKRLSHAKAEQEAELQKRGAAADPKQIAEAVDKSLKAAAPMIAQQVADVLESRRDQQSQSRKSRGLFSPSKGAYAYAQGAPDRKSVV